MKKELLFAILIAFLLGGFACTKTNNYYPNSETPIPVIGHSFKADFGIYVFQLDFINETEMKYTVLKGSNIGFSETVQITRREIRTNAFMVYWQEADKTTVTHMEDFDKGIVYTNITTPDNEFINLQGTLTFIK